MTQADVYELPLIGLYMWKTKTIFEDMELGVPTFLTVKIHLMTHRSANVREVQDVFEHSSPL